MPFQRLHKAIYKGCDKNHNPRKGTETNTMSLCTALATAIRTIIPARGRKHVEHLIGDDLANLHKNHNPRKGTETMHDKTYQSV